jgi:hypothetical protein
MQTISGIHYNWSLPGLGNEEYFALIRNFRRHGFLLLFLFGASPAVCASFVQGRAHALEPLGPDTFHLPHATSLRMGRLGYQSDAQAALNVSYNCLEGYAASLHGALTTPHPPYEAIGVRNPGGEYNQLATSLLQIENEFYGIIASAASSTWRCAAWTSTPSRPPASPSPRCASWMSSCCIACWPTARPTRPRRLWRWRATSTARPRPGATRASSSSAAPSQWP